jgi:hypothetical protein
MSQVTSSTTNVEKFTGSDRLGWQTIFVPIIKSVAQPEVLNRITNGADGQAILKSPGARPVPPTVAHLILLPARSAQLETDSFKTALEFWKMDEKKFIDANASGMELLIKYIHPSVLQQYVYGKMTTTGDFREAFNLLDAQFGEHNLDEVVHSMDDSVLYTTLHDNLRIDTTWASFLNEFMVLFHPYFNPTLNREARLLMLNHDGEGVQAKQALNIVIRAIQRSDRKWCSHLSRWETTHFQDRTLKSLNTYMKRQDALPIVPANRKRNHDDGQTISSEQPNAKLLKLKVTKLNEIKVLNGKLNALSHPNKAKNNGSVQQSSNKKAATTSSPPMYAKSNNHPQYSSANYKSALKVCWNCGDVKHATPTCPVTSCAYCKQAGFPDCNQGFWNCPNKRNDKKIPLKYMYLPPASCHT